MSMFARRQRGARLAGSLGHHDTAAPAVALSHLMRRLKLVLVASGLAITFVAIPAYGGHSATDGRIAFIADTQGHPQLFTIQPDGTGTTEVTRRAGGIGGFGGTDWSPDGSTLLYVVSTNRDLIYKTALDGTATHRVSARCVKLCLGDGFPVYARSGTKIAFERAYGPIKNDNAAVVAIFTMKIDGSGLRQLTQKKRPTSSEDHRATWSPDGKRIAFQRFNHTAVPRNLGAIFVMNANGTSVHRLTPWSMDANNPKWSRDGTRILFNDYGEPARGKDSNLYTVRVDGTGVTRLTHYTGGHAQAFANGWSPSGTQIVFHLLDDSNGAEVNQLFVMNADGSGAYALTHLGGDANPRQAAWGTTR